MPALRAVLFDIDDTLYSTTEFAACARRSAVEAMVRTGLKVPPAEVLHELQETIVEFGSNYEHHLEKLLDRLPARSHSGVNRAILIAAGIAAYHDAKFTMLKPFPDVLPALRRLARTPLIRGVVSDGLSLKQAEKLIRLRVYPLLTPGAIFISDQIGIAKPNPKIYERACEDLEVAPAETVMVGDHPVKDIDAAAAAGIRTVLVTRGGRHAGEVGCSTPDAVIRTFKEFLTILRRRFKVPALS